MNDDIKKLMDDYQEGHSDFQIENFIIKSQGSRWMQYQQCLREIKGRINIISKWESRKIKKRFFKRRISRSKKPPNVIRAEREMEIFVKLAKEFKRDLGEITPDRRKYLEEQSWFEKAKRMIGVDLLVSNGQGISKATIEFILQLPGSYRKELVLGILNDPQYKRKMIEWIINQ